MSGQDILQEPRQAVFRVTENGESMYFSVPESVELLQAAAHLRNYLSDENAGTKFTAIFPHGEKITHIFNKTFGVKITLRKIDQVRRAAI